MESFYGKPSGKRREKYATGKRTSKNSVICKKNKIILLWLLGSFLQVLSGLLFLRYYLLGITFILYLLKYNVFFHFNVSVCC